MKIKKNDNILVIKGKDRNKTGKVIGILPEKGKVVVGGVNIIKRHQRPKKSGQKGQILSVEAPLRVENIMVICPKCGAPARVGYKKLENGEKVRICKKCNQEI
ncbi:50S ribosomal protein L24 [Patescibacteria group bacterium]|nr:50S ribosomal protein L24 [Patescibacteria group bacterium]MBU4580592.1 50S ribosomal protein L24 [Patescibacteria group bacterium]